MKNVSFLKRPSKDMSYSPVTISYYEFVVDTNTLFFEQKMNQWHDDMPLEDLYVLEDAREELMSILAAHMHEWLTAKQLGILQELLKGKSQCEIAELYKMPQCSVSQMLHGFYRNTTPKTRYPGVLERLRVGMLSRPDARECLTTLGILGFVEAEQSKIEKDRNEKTETK